MGEHFSDYDDRTEDRAQARQATESRMTKAVAKRFFEIYQQGKTAEAVKLLQTNGITLGPGLVKSLLNALDPADLIRIGRVRTVKEINEENGVPGLDDLGQKLQDRARGK